LEKDERKSNILLSNRLACKALHCVSAIALDIGLGGKSGINASDGDRTMDFNVLARPFTGYALEIGNKPVDAVRHIRVVPDVDIANIVRGRLAGAALVEHQLIEGEYVGLVAAGLGNDALLYMGVLHAQRKERQ
jgi:hypothetical protein